jgi:hypothetical protein
MSPLGEQVAVWQLIVGIVGTRDGAPAQVAVAIFDGVGRGAGKPLGNLRKAWATAREEALAAGRPVVEWVFSTPRGTRLDPRNARRAFAAVARAAKLSPHLTPHSLRNSYASILISEGVSPAYVQRQLGHASITVDTYGSWLPSTDTSAVDRLDGARVANGSKVQRAVAAFFASYSPDSDASPFDGYRCSAGTHRAFWYC